VKYASDFRHTARDSLRGKWGIAVLAGLIASLLGAVTSNGPKIEFYYGDNGASIGFSYADQQIFSSSEGWLPELNAVIVGGAVYIILAAVVMTIVFFVLGSIISVGYARFNLDLLDRYKKPELNTLFAYFPYWKNTATVSLLQTVYTLLWSLLFIIPGIIASYSYSMTSYILAEYPDMAPGEAISRSKEMMSGNRFRLFCLQISFIGWEILSSFTLGIGYLWLNPYRKAATAAFYKDISGNHVQTPRDFV